MLRHIATAAALVGALAGCQEPEPELITVPQIGPEFDLRPRTMAATAQAAPWAEGGRIALHGDEIFAVDRDNGTLVVADTDLDAVARTIDIGAWPFEVVVGPDGTAWVTERQSGDVVRIPPNSAKRTERTAIAPGITGIALSPETDVLFVASTDTDTVYALDTRSMAILSTAEVTRPKALVALGEGRLVATTGGQRAISLHLDSQSQALILGEKTRLRTSNIDPVATKAYRPDGRVSMATSATIQPETGQAIIAHQIVFPGTMDTVNAAAPSTGYYSPPPPPQARPDRPVEVTTTGVGVGYKDPIPTPAPEDPPPAPPVSTPSDIAHHPTHTLAFVAGSGSDNVMVVNTAMANPMGAPLALLRTGERPLAVTISADGQWLFVLQNHGFELVKMDLMPLIAELTGETFTQVQLRHRAPAPVAALTIGEDLLSETGRVGRRIFTFTRFPGLSRDGQFSCENCHFEGGDDGLVWFGNIGPRQTPSLAGRMEGTAPFNWLGSEGELRDNLALTVGRMGGDSLSGPQLEALEGFMLEGLRPKPNPYRHPEGLTESQIRGKALFEDPTLGCSGCHSGPTFTDGQQHNIGTASEVEQQRAARNPEIGTYNTPSLLGLHSTAPYLHDGSAPTLEALLLRKARAANIGIGLSLESRDDLIAYLKTL